MLRRALTVAAVVAAAAATATPAAADELEDYLDRAGAAEYGGTRIVMTMWQDRTYARVDEVEHSKGTTVILDPDRGAMMGGGKTTGADGDGMALPAWAGSHASDRYTVDAAVETRRAGRPALAVTVRQGGAPRARLVLDEETSAPLSTEVFDGDGGLFRYATFTEFDPQPRRAPALMRQDAGYEVVAPAAAAGVPAAAAGYSLVDVYEDAAGVRQAFYSDGLFSFSVFATPAGAGKVDFEGAAAFATNESSYLLIVEPAELWVRWDTGGGGYALVGNLPPDHLEEVLADLPRPEPGSLWRRLWRTFFD